MNGQNKTIVVKKLEARKRISFEYPGAELSKRLDALRKAYLLHDPRNKELLKYFPIAFVSCIESYFRGVIKILIDSSEDYLEKSRNLLRQQKTFPFDAIKELRGDEITIGDIIALSVPMSNLKNIENSMDELIGDFRKKISEVHNREDVVVSRKPKSPIMKNPEETFRYVEKTFEFRHIFCHESASKFDVKEKEKEISKCVEASLIFLDAAEELIAQTLFPGKSTAEEEMGRALQKECGNERESIASSLKNADNLSEKQKAKLEEANDSCGMFVEKAVEAENLFYKEGEIRKTVRDNFSFRFLRLWRKHIEELIKSIDK